MDVVGYLLSFLVMLLSKKRITLPSVILIIKIRCGMSKIKITTLFAIVTLLVLSACGGGHVVTAEADHYVNLLDHEQRTLEQARIQEALNQKAAQ
jgi:hypothetical protein